MQMRSGPAQAQRSEHRIALEDGLDAAALERHGQQIADALSQGHTRVQVDLGAVSTLPLPTLSVLCRVLRQHAGRPGTVLVVVGGPPHAQRTIELCDIEGVEQSEPG